MNTPGTEDIMEKKDESQQEIKAELLHRIAAEGQTLTPRQLRLVLAFLRGLK
jgi:hypothetical protein